MTTAHDLQTALMELNPSHLELTNESHMHAGYFDGKESHFKLVIVSEDFIGKRLAARHQLIYALASPLLTSSGGTIHALAIHAYTSDEWTALGQAPNSPNCAGKNIS
ncbi:MAG: BolA family protein [Moraxella sp.]|nr:BolA family protein [Moraxella sp.]